MYYSYFQSETSYTCDDLGGERQRLNCIKIDTFGDCDPVGTQWLDCDSACNAVKDPAFTIETSDSGSKNSDGLFDYNYSPASLVPLSVRLSFLQAELARDGVPREALTAQAASQFVVDVFEEYMGCAVSSSSMNCSLLSFVVLTCIVYSISQGWYCGTFILQVSK